MVFNLVRRTPAFVRKYSPMSFSLPRFEELSEHRKTKSPAIAVPSQNYSPPAALCQTAKATANTKSSCSPPPSL